MYFNISPNLSNYIKTFGVIHYNDSISIQIDSLSDLLLDELLNWVNYYNIKNNGNRQDFKLNLNIQNQNCIGCFPKIWDWKKRLCILCVDYIEN